MRFLGIALMLLFCWSALGQDGKTPVEPQALSVLYSSDASGQLFPLEAQSLRITRKYHALGFTGGTAIYRVKGEASPVRLKTGTPVFIVRLGSNLDPLEAFHFYRFNSVEGSRVVPIVDFNALGSTSKIPLDSYVIDFNAAKYGAASFKVTPTQALVPGEYCFDSRKPDNPWPGKSAGFCLVWTQPGISRFLTYHSVDPGGKT